MKLTQSYIRKLIMEEVAAAKQTPQVQQSMLDKSLSMFVTNSSSALKNATNEVQVLEVLRKIIKALPLNRMYVSRALMMLAKEMSVQEKEVTGPTK